MGHVSEEKEQLSHKSRFCFPSINSNWTGEMKMYIAIRRSSCSAAWGKKKTATSQLSCEPPSNDLKILSCSKSLPANLPSSEKKKGVKLSKDRDLRNEFLRFQKILESASGVGTGDGTTSNSFSRAPGYRDFGMLLEDYPAASSQKEVKSGAGLVLEKIGKYAALNDNALENPYADCFLTDASKGSKR
jgi:hypothetical protein